MPNLLPPLDPEAAPDFGRDPHGYYLWHLQHNGHVYVAFRRVADQYRLLNPARPVSADMLLHVLRWQTGVRSNGEPFRVNNVVTPLYARLYLRERPTAVIAVRGSQLDAMSEAEWAALLALVPPEVPGA